MVNNHCGHPLIKFNAITPPTAASGIDKTTSKLSLNDLKSALINKYKIIIASQKLPVRLVSADFNLSAAPE